MINLAALGEEDPYGAAAGAEEMRRYSHFEILLRVDGSLNELGHGAMGATSRAQDTVLQSSVALKVIRKHVADTPEERAVDNGGLAEVALAKARQLRPDAGPLHLALAGHFLRVNHDESQAEIELAAAVDSERSV